MESISAIALKILSYNESTGKSLILAKKSATKEMVRISGFYLGADDLVGQSIILEGEQKDDFIKAGKITKGKDLRFLPYLKELFDGKSIVGLTPQILYALNSQIGGKWPEYFNANSENTINRIDIDSKSKMLAKNGWDRFKPFSKDYAILRNQGLSHRQAFNAIVSYGKMASNIIVTDPYRLSRVKGIGFKTSDKIALEKGIAPDASIRINSLIEESVLRMESQGSTIFPTRQVCATAANNGQIQYSKIDHHINSMPSSVFKKTRNEDGGQGLVKSSSIYQAKEIASEIKRLSKGSQKSQLNASDIPSKWPLKEKQIEAVNTSLNSKFSIITGRPGTGKSTIADQVIKGVKIENPSSKIAACALSGKAARRLSETTGVPTNTIHSLLGFKPGKGFSKGDDNKLDIDAIVIDEASMIDERLFLCLLRALPDHAKVIVMGDYEQLPSVNPGQVLRDMIESKCIPVSTLVDILRVEKGNSLVPNAHKIADGIIPDLNTPEGDNFQWIDSDNDEDICAKIKEISQNEINGCGISSNDIQILTPQMNKGPGTNSLNILVSDIFNTNKNKHVHLNNMGETYRVGDRVMQVKKNDYELGLNNGDIGEITSIDFKNKTVELALSDKKVDVPFKKMGNISLANAITIHKSQGSEYPVVIIPISKSHERMLNIELIYTAVTRAKSKVYLVGDRNVLKRSLSKEKNKKRNTILKHIIKNSYKNELSKDLKSRPSL